MNPQPLRPTAVETVLFEPDEHAVIAVLPGALWLSQGDIVELDAPPREARVLSTRLQLRGNEARVLIVLDVLDDGGVEVLRGTTPAEVMLGADVDQPLHVGDELDQALEQLTADIQADIQLEPGPDEA